jgi:hypothetical protein
MAEKKSRAVIGRFKAPAKPTAKFSHSDGWDGALSDALTKTGWKKGPHDNVKVEFFANVEVVNPGKIVEYIVHLTPSG